MFCQRFMLHPCMQADNPPGCGLHCSSPCWCHKQLAPSDGNSAPQLAVLLLCAWPDSCSRGGGQGSPLLCLQGAAHAPDRQTPGRQPGESCQATLFQPEAHLQGRLHRGIKTQSHTAPKGTNLRLLSIAWGTVFAAMLQVCIPDAANMHCQSGSRNIPVPAACSWCCWWAAVGRLRALRWSTVLGRCLQQPQWCQRCKTWQTMEILTACTRRQHASMPCRPDMQMSLAMRAQTLPSAQQQKCPE